jgi:hypothetical protein
MRKIKVLAPITLSATAWTPIAVNVPAFSVALQLRTAADIYLCHETTGSYWTLKSGSTMTFDLEGINLANAPLSTNLITNGTFTGNANGWTLPGGWAYSSNEARKSGAGTTAMTQSVAVTPGMLYKISMTWTALTVGSFTVNLGGGNASEAMASAATYVNYLVAGRSTSPNISILPAGDTTRGNVDTITMYKMDGQFLLAKAAAATPVLEILALI